ncbi:MAG: transketolase C-terminal domain-containing protein [Myxococcota bacterium]|nr:transketolase C-terminal domain-containing protein [Myxococcota bacterium]
MSIVVRPHAQNLVQWAKDKPDVLVLSADLTASCEASDFQAAYPDRFFSFGLGEQNMMGFAAGLAREGFYPFVHTFAVFICRRPFDQVAMSIAYPNLPVRLIGFLPGITTPGGVTHQAIDDVGLMRLLPNMTVLDCGDATEVASALDVAQAVDGPVYLRMLRGNVPRLFDPACPMVLNTARVLEQGSDVTILTEGICTEEALRATAVLRPKGISFRHLHISTLKPFDDPLVREAIACAQLGVITLENHSVIGGLGSATAELMAESGSAKRLIRLGLQDQYAHGASQAYLMKEHGLDAMALVRAVERLTGETFNVRETDLAAVDLSLDQQRAKAEDL